MFTVTFKFCVNWILGAGIVLQVGPPEYRHFATFTATFTVISVNSGIFPSGFLNGAFWN